MDNYIKQTGPVWPVKSKCKSVLTLTVYSNFCPFISIYSKAATSTHFSHWWHTRSHVSVCFHVHSSLTFLFVYQSQHTASTLFEKDLKKMEVQRKEWVQKRKKKCFRHRVDINLLSPSFNDVKVLLLLTKQNFRNFLPCCPLNAELEMRNSFCRDGHSFCTTYAGLCGLTFFFFAGTCGARGVLSRLSLLCGSCFSVRQGGAAGSCLLSTLIIYDTSSHLQELSFCLYTLLSLSLSHRHKHTHTHCFCLWGHYLN